MSNNDFFGELEEEIGFGSKTPTPSPSLRQPPSNEGKRPKPPIPRNGQKSPTKIDGWSEQNTQKKILWKPKVHVPAHKQLERTLMSQSGVIVVILAVSASDRMPLREPHLETRWFSYSKEQAPVIASILETMKRSYLQTIQDLPEIEWKEVNRIIRSDLERAIESITTHKPVVIPVILSI
jgi:mRNA degradation ribonuclease J1/J2